MGRQVELYIGIHWKGKGTMNEAQRLGQTSYHTMRDKKTVGIRTHGW